MSTLHFWNLSLFTVQILICKMRVSWDWNVYIHWSYHRRTLNTLRVHRLYGLPKVHKLGVSPVLDKFKSTYHAVAQWLAEFLKPIHRELTKYSVRDTFVFIEHIRDRNVNNNTMLSLDVSSLFYQCSFSWDGWVYMWSHNWKPIQYWSTGHST